MPHFDKPFMVYVDASDMVVGAILTQQYDKIGMPVYYCSKWLNPMEAQWSIYEHEMYAII